MKKINFVMVSNKLEVIILQVRFIIGFCRYSGLC